MAYDEALAERIRVILAPHLRTGAQLAEWIRRGVAYARSLPGERRAR